MNLSNFASSKNKSGERIRIIDGKYDFTIKKNNRPDVTFNIDVSSYSHELITLYFMYPINHSMLVGLINLLLILFMRHQITIA